MVLITSASGSSTPHALQRYESARPSGNIVHKILGREDPDVTMRPAQLRRGTLELVYLDAASAIAAEELHSRGEVLALAHDVDGISMSYVVGDGDIGRRQDGSVRSVWIVTVPFQQVLA
ncbi:hypothetical protein SK224_00205 [Microbacterium sp. BG28]|uniref:hypothetical protein n=1 Tax=Microbacterium sp. BG28 TaxID=3097356 RepID=UPI002A59F0DD|nr:hypothetical protein [Microbacterium sp. BG28]MDY0827541.1 hypothetical protein [Microbacterium sp. BG28]